MVKPIMGNDTVLQVVYLFIRRKILRWSNNYKRTSFLFFSLVKQSHWFVPELLIFPDQILCFRCALWVHLSWSCALCVHNTIALKNVAKVNTRSRSCSRRWGKNTRVDLIRLDDCVMIVTYFFLSKKNFHLLHIACIQYFLF